jgi:hypothetical protein
MLSNSLNIKSQTENMITSYDANDTVTFTQSLGSIMRSILDFDSYTSVAGSNETPSVEEFYGFTRNVVKDVPMFERKADQDREREAQKARVAAKRELREMNVNGSKILLRSSKINPQVELAEGYQWGTADYIQAPLALIIGSLHAMPSGSNGPECSSNATSLRSYLLEGFAYSEADYSETEE